MQSQAPDSAPVLKYADFISAVYTEGFKDFGFHLEETHQRSKYVTLAATEEVIDITGAAATVAPRFKKISCSGVDPCRLVEVSEYKSRQTNCVWCYGPNPVNPEKTRHSASYFCKGCGSPLALICFLPWHRFLNSV